MKRLFALAVFGWLFALSPPAAASSAYIGINLVLRAGPDIGYPSVMILPAGTYVEIYGCLPDYTWCDVGVHGWRGWVAATYLQYYYGSTWVYLPAYGPRIGVPVVTFVLGTYWGNHYRHTSWYRERERWERSPPRNLPPPRRTPSFRPRVPPPAHPVRPGNRHPATMRPAASPGYRPAPQARSMPQSRQTTQSKRTEQHRKTKKADRGGGR